MYVACCGALCVVACYSCFVVWCGFNVVLCLLCVVRSSSLSVFFVGGCWLVVVGGLVYVVGGRLQFLCVLIVVRFVIGLCCLLRVACFPLLLCILCRLSCGARCWGLVDTCCFVVCWLLLVVCCFLRLVVVCAVVGCCWLLVDGRWALFVGC